MSAAWDPRLLQAARAQEVPPCRWYGDGGRLPAEVVLAIAAVEFGVTEAEIASASRLQRFTAPRAFVAWALRSLGRRLSYARIGRIMGGRDHSTVARLHQVAVAMRQRDPVFDGACQRLAYRFYTMESSHADR